ncbi:MAG: MFS transporter [Solirubrobacterales bacterium]|jgi:EmrB/QacA subfamily drug resistance transporter|nr:MFS transporter [Solirubrobacterales bacterium]
MTEIEDVASEVRQHYGVTLAALVMGALAYALSQTLVAPALPEIQRELGTTTTTVTYVLTVYLLSASIATPILGRFGDMFGKERMLLLTLIFFAVGSTLCAISSSIEVLILGRMIQGAAGAVFPLSFGIIRDEFPPERVAAGIGLISATFGIGGGVGLVLSGVIVDNLSYEWIFWLGLASVAIAIPAVHFFVPESPIKNPAKIDWGGAGLLSAGLISLLVGISEGNSWGWGSPRVVALFILAAIILTFWVRFERRHPEPLVDMKMMRRRAVFTTNATGFLIGFGMFGSFILIPQFVQMPTAAGFGFGSTVTEAGLFMLPSAGVMLFAGPIAGTLGTRYGSRLPLIIGTVLTGLAFVALALFHDSHLPIYLTSAVLGLGIGFSFAAMANLVVEAVDQSETGIATGINTIMRTIGGSLGGQIAASIVAASVVTTTGLPKESGFTEAFVISAVAMGFAVIAALFVPGRQSTSTSSTGGRDMASVAVERE